MGLSLVRVTRRRLQTFGRSQRRGFTLIELLVVIAIIGVLVGLLLPSVQAARESGRRAACINHLRQIGIGLHNYADGHKAFPVGWPPGGAMQAEWGWPALLLPMLEEQSLYDALGVERRRLADVTGDATLRPLLQTRLPLFRCPTDLTPSLLPGTDNTNPRWDRRFDCSNCPAGFEPAASNYVGNAGFADPATTSNSSSNGIFWSATPVRMTQITDGLSKTFAVGERDDRCRSATWIGVRNPPGPDMWGSYWVRGRVSVKLNDPRPVAPTNTCTEGFSSGHPGGASFLYCDGSVHSINDDIAFSNGGVTVNNNSPVPDVNTLGVYQLLGIRDDGMVTSTP
jgi:prepilin-type N-terminal cleavage/methylation domain-containing protein/prepilin-type processing-associated H-X9-DG protein